MNENSVEMTVVPKNWFALIRKIYLAHDDPLEWLLCRIMPALFFYTNSHFL